MSTKNKIYLTITILFSVTMISALSITSYIYLQNFKEENYSDLEAIGSILLFTIAALVGLFLAFRVYNSGLSESQRRTDTVSGQKTSQSLVSQQEVEDALKDRESYRRLVEFSPDGIMIHCEEKIVYINQAGLDLFGASSSSEIINRSILDIIPQRYKQVVKKQVQKSYSSREFAYRYNQKCIRLDGTLFDVEVSGIPIDYMGKDATLALMRDITEKKLNEELLRKSEKLSVVGQLSAGIAHEIRNPLTSVKGFLQLLQKDIVTSDIKEKGKYVEIILSELDRVESIIHEFLFLARPNQDIAFKEKSLLSIIEQIKTLLDSQAILHDVQIVLEADDETLPNIDCEESQLKQVFINIIKNAIESMPNGGLIVIEVRKKDEEHIYIKIADQGKGISKERIKKLGEPFYSTKEKGTGLGLMISYKIIESHNGRIVVESEENKGTEFTIILPVHPNFIEKKQRINQETENLVHS
ncbi:ATP-binding protein [Anaerobacillus sp. MEB173]|uniref:ATP-binding protein n=1 Tax=Anaerobacillus sp. MEB173 TaxID=3383345 RepID=UPI003F9375D9